MHDQARTVRLCHDILLHVEIQQVVREAYPDHSAWEVGGKYYDPRSTPEEPRWFMVDCKLVSPDGVDAWMIGRMSASCSSP